jgi:hypothetical protein
VVARRAAWVLVAALGCGGGGGSSASDFTLALLEGRWEGDYYGDPVATGTIFGLPFGIGPHYKLRAMLSRTGEESYEGTLWAYDPILYDTVPALAVGRIAISVLVDASGERYVRLDIYLPELRSGSYDMVEASDGRVNAWSDADSVHLTFRAEE